MPTKLNILCWVNHVDSKVSSISIHEIIKKIDSKDD